MKILKNIYIRVSAAFLLSVALNAFWIGIIHLICKVFSGSFIWVLTSFWWAPWLWMFTFGAGLTIFSIAFIGIMMSKK